MATQFQTQPFAIPMANMNLPPSEALNQIMDNLNHLNAIVNQAVTTIHSRIKQESQLLTSISQRIDNAYKKTALIASNPKKSTTVFSSSNYPQPITTTTNKPLINKTTNTIHPIQPKRSKYNLSLKQRNERPENIETVSLLQSINQKTSKNKNVNTENKTLQNTQIPQWVSSVADCVIFDTNCNAYKPSKNSEMQMRHYKKRQKISKNDNKMAEQPPSIGDKNYNLETERITYGNRIKYHPVLDRDNMPKFQDVNLFEGNDNVAVVNDIQWMNNNNGKEELFIVPSDVLNERYMNMEFEYGYDIKPPVRTDMIENEIQLDEKQEEKAEVISVHSYPTPQGNIVNENKQNVVNEPKLHGYSTPLDVIDEKENDSLPVKQPVIAEVKAQNKSLPKEDVNIEENKEIMVSDENKKENKNVIGKHEDKEQGNNDVEKGVIRFVFDVNALKNAKEKLNKKEDRKECKEIKMDKEESLQGNIFMAIKNLRKFHADSDDEDDENGSFYDSD